MPFANIFERFRPAKVSQEAKPVTAPKPDFEIRRNGMVELKHPELFSETYLLEIFKQPELKRLLSHSEPDSEILDNAVRLLMVFCQAMDQKYLLYERKNLVFIRARFQLDFDDEPTQGVHFLPQENLIRLPTQILLRNSVTPELITQFQLWGDEEADHCIFNQFKSSTPAEASFLYDKVDYVVLDHEFHALQSNIRQAYREHMPAEKIQELEALLVAARARRAAKKQKSH